MRATLAAPRAKARRNCGPRLGLLFPSAWSVFDLISRKGKCCATSAQPTQNTQVMRLAKRKTLWPSVIIRPLFVFHPRQSVKSVDKPLSSSFVLFVSFVVKNVLESYLKYPIFIP